MASTTRDRLVLKRSLKRARVFEIRKIVRRIRLLSNKRGTDEQLEGHRRRTERQVVEMDNIKDLNLDLLVDSIYQSPLLVKELMDLKEPPSDMTERAKWRLLGSKSTKQLIQRSLQHATKREMALNSQPVGDNGDRRDGDTDNSDSSGNSDIGDTCDVSNEEHDATDDSVTNKNKNLAKPIATCQHNIIVLPHSNRSTDNIIDEPDVRSILSDSSSGALIRKETNRTRQSTSMKQKTTLGRKKTIQTNKLAMKTNMNSMFIGSLSMKEEKRKRGTKDSRNRLGQRTRRQIWETKYKEKANHIIRRGGEGKDDRLPKPDKRLQQMRSSRKPSVSSTGRNRGYRTEHNNNVTAINFDDIPLHPSWQASIQRKEQQSITQSFQGSRIVFNDSD